MPPSLFFGDRALSSKLHSMTGFGRGDGGDAQYVWSWELKSVNGRGFDLR